MEIDRRQFVVTSTAITLMAAVARAQNATATAPAATTAAATMIDAGPLSDFSTDGVFDDFRPLGFFIIRRDKQLFALSSVCTHKGCMVQLQDDNSFFCKCHNSHFDPAGKVTKGPAKKDLPRLAVATDERLHVQVDLNRKFAPGHFVPPATQE
jgi:cytochrome b6-f complex iron-sulfur subunit